LGKRKRKRREKKSKLKRGRKGDIQYLRGQDKGGRGSKMSVFVQCPQKEIKVQIEKGNKSPNRKGK
jgi:hypothetical protein